MKIAKGLSLCIGNKGFYLGWLLVKTIRPRKKPQSSIMTTGLRCDLVIGRVVRPIAKLYKWKFWFGNKYEKALLNPWNSGNHWFLLRIPFFIGLFVSGSFICGKYNPGGYLGFRTAEVDKWTHRRTAVWGSKGEVVSWADDYAWGDESENGNIYAEPTASLRLDMRK